MTYIARKYNYTLETISVRAGHHHPQPQSNKSPFYRKTSFRPTIYYFSTQKEIKIKLENLLPASRSSASKDTLAGRRVLYSVRDRRALVK
jgi:hypothetical protein